MILLWFFLGIALIFAIARYNESNKLFWTFLFAYVMGFAGAKMAIDVHRGNEKQSIVNLTQMYPTQAPTATLSTLSYYITSVTPKANNVVTAQKLVGQDADIATNETNATLSKVFERTRDQPRLTVKSSELGLKEFFFNSS